MKRLVLLTLVVMSSGCVRLAGQCKEFTVIPIVSIVGEKRCRAAGAALIRGGGSD